VNEIEDRLAPQRRVEDAAVIADEAVATAVLDGVNCAVNWSEPPGSIVYALAASGREKSAGVGAPKRNVPGAFPVFTRLNTAGVAAIPTSLVAKETVEAAPGGRASVAPVGVTASGMATLTLLGSFVKRLREPVSCVPAIAEPTTVAETVNALIPPSEIENDVGLTEKAAPVVVADTVRGARPFDVIEIVCGVAVAPHPV
jgi:hypothetical protein